jgi:capsular exopolysaccharide synthesis family protein
MRKPRLQSVLGVPNNTGLSNYLSGNIDAEIIHSPADEKIHIIPSGPIPPNPVELISSRRMKTLLQDMKNQYDYVFIDSPPIIHLADGIILSTLTEGTVLVVRAGKVTTDVFSAGLKKLNEFDPHILGVVLNGMSTRFAGSQSYYYYNYRSYVSED